MNTLLNEITTLLDAAGLPGSAAEAGRILDAGRAGLATTLPLTDAAALSERVLSMARRRAQGEPLAYVTGRELFMGLELIADAGALVPREETELLDHTALALLGACGTAAPRVIDMTDGCVTLARRNVVHTGVADRVAVAQGDLFAGLVGLELEGTADLIVCNPPYISQGRLAGDRAPLLEHEPREAFDGGPYGLSIHQRVIREALPYLREGGTLMFEIGLGQDRQLIRLFDRAKGYSSLLAVPNAAGEVRVVAGRKESKMASASITGI